MRHSKLLFALLSAKRIARRGSILLALSAGVVGASGCALFEPTPAWELPPPPPPETVIVKPGALTRGALDNGLTIMVLEDHSLPLVALGISLKHGAGSVDPALAGVAVLTAEIMNRGAGDRDALELAQAIDDIGGSLSVAAGWDGLAVSVSGLSGDLGILSEILADVTLRPKLADTEFDKAKAEQLAGLEGAKDDPGTLVSWAAMDVIYPDHRYGTPRSGTEQTVSALDIEAVRRFYAERFIPNDAILWAVGDLDARTFLKNADEIFGEWLSHSPPDDPKSTPVRAPAKRRVVIVDEPDLVQSRIVLIHEGLSRTDERRIAASLMNDVLGGSGFSSRLMKTLRSNEGLTYSVGSGFSLRRQPGPFRVSTFTRVSKTARAIRILLDEVEAIRTSNAPTATELSKAKSYSIGSFGLGLETSAAVLSSLVNLESYGLPADSLDTYRGRIRAVTLEDVERIARDLLHPDRFAIVVLGPAKDLSLEEFGEVEIRQP